MKAHQINLERYRTEGSKVFTTRPRGIEVREKSNINILETQHSRIDIIVPESISSVNPSFLEEFLHDVVVKLGETGFHNKFHFINEGHYNIQSDLEEGIGRILRDQTALNQ